MPDMEEFTQLKYEKNLDDTRAYFCFYALNSDLEKEILGYIERLLTSLGKPKSYVNIVYTCIKELTVNALKANYKRIFFDMYIVENELADIATYDKWLELFRLEIEEHGKENFARIAQERKIPVELEMYLEDSFFVVHIKNPTPMTDIERERVEKNLAKGESVSSLQELIEESGDDIYKEGAGFGLAMVVVLLKSIGGGRNNISIYTDDEGITHTIVKFPL